jgi:SnoaL-like protein
MADVLLAPRKGEVAQQRSDGTAWWLASEATAPAVGPGAVRVVTSGRLPRIPTSAPKLGRAWRPATPICCDRSTRTGAAATGGPVSRSTTRRWSGAGRTSSPAGVYEDARDPNPRLRAWLDGWEHWRAEADDYLELGDHVVVLASYHGRGKGSGVEIHQQGAHVFELRDGKVVRLEIFASRDKAIESVRSAPSGERDRVG